jgi:hypothetical protein
MNFIPTTLRYLVVINCFLSIGSAAHHLPCKGSINGMNGAIKQVVSPKITHRFAHATHPSAMNILTKNSTLFQRFCCHMFLQPVHLGLRKVQWWPYVNAAHNSFLEFAQHQDSHPFTEVQITSQNVWSDTSPLHSTPSSDTDHDTFVYNLVMDPHSKLDRTIVFDSQEPTHTPTIKRVTQLGLGSDRLQNSTDPETKAWIEFLTHAHLKDDIPAKTPDSVAQAYTMIDLTAWSPKTQKRYLDTLSPQKPLNQKELETIIGIIDFCLEKGYPLANMVKYTGLCPDVITTIIDQLNHRPQS